ncbi:hypothetical protein BGZ76_004948 [Entomortierella beljakovae]|nr:hypothetical protein BGZ76_004948 [Entomortierella beljakovae]
MTYDLSNNQQYYECPETGICSLSQQVNYYMNSYAANGMTATVGYEIGIPAYPDKNHDPTHQLPLIQSELTPILAAQGAKGGFFWEFATRCSGVIPAFDGSNPTTTGTTPTSTTPGPTSTNPTTTTTSVGPTSTPSCSAPAWSASTAYSGGAVVSYNGHQYTAQWWSQNNIPTAGAPWTDNGLCSGGSNPGGSCAGVNAWSTSTAYNSGAKVTYGGFTYTAQWWTQGETPGSASVWTKGAACAATQRRRRHYL